MLAEILQDILRPSVLTPWMLGMVFGIFVGATPGLTATMAVALIVPISFHLEPSAGLAMVVGVSFTAIFAGDIPAVFLRIPGTPASGAIILDGYQLARQGKSQLALMLDLVCSAAGGLIGVILLILVAPQLARFGLAFSNYERFWLAAIGLSMSALVSRGNTLHALLSATLGVAVSTIGVDDVTNVPRYTFGSMDLHRSSQDVFIPIMIGLFGLSEVLRGVWQGNGELGAAVARSDPAPWTDVLRIALLQKWTVVKSAVLGTFIGALPGAGADVAAWGAYGLAKRTARNPSEFGLGALEGVTAPTSANNAAVGGAWIPALVFGVPGDSVTAIVLGALLMYNIRPGPNIFTDNTREMHSLFAIAVVTQFLLIPAGWLGVKTFSWIMRMPTGFVRCAVVVCSVVGAYSLNNNLIDVWIMCLFGLVGWYLESRQVPLAPLILGLILGPMVETELRSGLIKSGGEFLPFLTRPICLGMVGLLVTALLSRPVRIIAQRIRK